MSVQVATNVIHLLLESDFVELVNPYFSLHLMKEIDFPKILVLKLQEFLGLLQSEKDNKV